MNRRGFLGVLAAAIVTPMRAFLPAPPCVGAIQQATFKFARNDFQVLDTTRVDVFDRCEISWRYNGFHIETDSDGRY